MQFPIVHLNGSGKVALVKGYETAYEALTKAMVAVKLTAPHDRDYYPISGDAINTAMAEHMERTKKLQMMIFEMAVLAAYCRNPEQGHAEALDSVDPVR